MKRSFSDDLDNAVKKKTIQCRLSSCSGIYTARQQSYQ